MSHLPLRVRLRRLARILTPDGFALAPLWVQLVAIFTCSAAVVLLLSPLIGSVSLSYRLFADPSSYADAEGFAQLFFGFMQVGCGLILFSFIISVLSAALEQLIERIRGGTRPYRKSGHLLFVNQNPKLPLILDEINERYRLLRGDVDVVILLGDRAQVGAFSETLEPNRWPCLHLYVRQGDLLNFETYRRVSAFGALAFVVLATDENEAEFHQDNFNLKILTTLVNEPAWVEHLVNRLKQYRPIKCAIELSNQMQSRLIAQSLTRVGRESLFSVATPADVIGRVLSRSVIDLVYYKIYSEVFSFDGQSIYFVDPQRFAAQGLVPGRPFEDLCRSFTRGILIGYSSAVDGELRIHLAPIGQPLAPGDWLLVIARNTDAVEFAARAPAGPQDSTGIVPPSERQRRNLCVIGRARSFHHLKSFLHEDSRNLLEDAHIVLPEDGDYFHPEFIDRLHRGNFDSIIVNLEDEVGFRFTLYLLTFFAPDDPFLAKVVTVLRDPVIESLLNQNAKYRNTILSDKLAAKYITQLSFQKNLEAVYAELSAPEGSEFNLLDIDVHFPRARLTSRQSVMDALLAMGMIYVGTVDETRGVRFDADDFSGVRQLIVISRGEL